MIHSFSKIKTDRNYNEDFKTYQTIGILQYLPADLFWALIRSSVANPADLPLLSGEIIQIDLWPKWTDIEGTKATNYVEPDVFIRFENFDCIIEVKKTDGNGQRPDQWDDQIIAYGNTYPDETKLIYIVLGGNQDLSNGYRAIYPIVYNGHRAIYPIVHIVYKATWLKLLHAVNMALQERVAILNATTSTCRDIRIFQTVLESFAEYKEYDVEFLDSISQFHDINLTSKELDILWK